MIDDFVCMRDFNGLGSRVNELICTESACRARTEQKFLDTDLRLSSQRDDIKEIFAAMKGMAATMNKGVGIIIAANVGVTLFVTVVIFVLTKVWH